MEFEPGYAILAGLIGGALTCLPSESAPLLFKTLL